MIELSGDEASLNLSPDTRANQQLAEDEVYARNLQEQMDREFASQLEATIPHPPHHHHSLHTPPEHTSGLFIN